MLPSYNETMNNRRRVTMPAVLTGLHLCFLLVTLIVLLYAIIPQEYGVLWWEPSWSYCIWANGRPPPVVLISLNGFRSDHIHTTRQVLGPEALPNFARLERNGITARGLTPVYPSLTMPTHQTLLTGLYPQDHGVVCDRFRDQNHPNATFDHANQSSLNNAPWIEGWPEPIWATIQRSGGLTASLLWPLTDQPFKGDTPFQRVSQFAQQNNGCDVSYSFEQRARDLLTWLNSSRYRIDLALAYFDQPITVAQTHGATSRETIEKIVELDVIIGKLLDGLERVNQKKGVNLIIVSGHGMTGTSREKVIALEDYVPSEDYTSSFLSTVGMIYPEPGKEHELYEKLKTAHKHMHAHWLHDVPQSLHFSRNNSRMPPIILIPQVGWTLSPTRVATVPAASSGYDSTSPEMAAVLLASGPAFRVNQTVDDVQLIDLYSLLCALTGTRAQPNNGSLERVAHQLLKPELARRAIRMHSVWSEGTCVAVPYLVFTIGTLLVVYNVWALAMAWGIMTRQQAAMRRFETVSVLSEYGGPGKEWS